MDGTGIERKKIEIHRKEPYGTNQNRMGMAGSGRHQEERKYLVRN
jgi:hypothetical protein